MHLTPGFATAADKDVLDQNTVHYGLLSKGILGLYSTSTAGLGLRDFVEGVEKVVGEMSKRQDGTSRVGSWELEIALPKAGMWADEVRVGVVWKEGRRTGVSLKWMSIKCRVLIGVNDIERTRPQPVDVDLTLQCSGEGQEEAVLAGKGFSCEGALVEVSVVGARTMI